MVEKVEPAALVDLAQWVVTTQPPERRAGWVAPVALVGAEDMVVAAQAVPVLASCR